jgi:hypothetical protein
MLLLMLSVSYTHKIITSPSALTDHISDNTGSNSVPVEKTERPVYSDDSTSYRRPGLVYELL